MQYPPAGVANAAGCTTTSVGVAAFAAQCRHQMQPQHPPWGSRGRKRASHTNTRIAVRLHATNTAVLRPYAHLSFTAPPKGQPLKLPDTCHVSVMQARARAGGLRAACGRAGGLAFTSMLLEQATVVGRTHASWAERMLRGANTCFMGRNMLHGPKAALMALYSDRAYYRQLGSTIARLVQLAPLTFQRVP